MKYQQKGLRIADCRVPARLEINASVEDTGWAELPLYRQYTVALLRRYFRMALDMGRLPSVLGGAVFRAKVSSQKLHTFEDTVIFVHDVERCLDRLDDYSRMMLARIVFEEYTHEEMAEMLGLSKRQIVRQYVAALDAASQTLLDAEVLLSLDTLNRGRSVRSVLRQECESSEQHYADSPLPPKKPAARICCQEAKSPASRVYNGAERK